MKLETVIRRWMVVKSRYDHLATSDQHIPSAPDTSRFTETHKGNLEIRRYGSFGGEEYAYVFIVGSAFPLHITVFQEALAVAKKSGLRYRTVEGTAWSGIGIDDIKVIK